MAVLGGGGLGDIFGEILKRLPQGGGAPQGGGGQSGFGRRLWDSAPPRWLEPATARRWWRRLPDPGLSRSAWRCARRQRDAWGGAPAGGQPRGGTPLPLPGDSGPSGGGWKGNNPYGDIGDIVRGGGQSGGLLATILRSIFGSIIGRSAAPAGRSSGGGWMGWLIKLIVMRYGWRIVTGLFRGILRR